MECCIHQNVEAYRMCDKCKKYFCDVCYYDNKELTFTKTDDDDEYCKECMKNIVYIVCHVNSDSEIRLIPFRTHTKALDCLTRICYEIYEEYNEGKKYEGTDIYSIPDNYNNRLFIEIETCEE